MGWQRQDHVWLGQSEKGEPPTVMLVFLSIQTQHKHADRIRTRNCGTRTATVSFTCTRKAGRNGVPPSRSLSHAFLLPNARL
jgi:hypothetical protein